MAPAAAGSAGPSHGPSARSGPFGTVRCLPFCLKGPQRRAAFIPVRAVDSIVISSEQRRARARSHGHGAIIGVRPAAGPFRFRWPGLVTVLALPGKTRTRGLQSGRAAGILRAIPESARVVEGFSFVTPWRCAWMSLGPDPFLPENSITTALQFKNTLHDQLL
jgi:hypothetical protein